MQDQRIGVAGSLESCDALVMVILSGESRGMTLEIDSPSLASFGEEMKNTVMEIMETLGIPHAVIKVQDRGALDCTLRARTEAAAKRALAVPAGEKVSE